MQLDYLEQKMSVKKENHFADYEKIKNILKSSGINPTEEQLVNSDTTQVKPEPTKRRSFSMSNLGEKYTQIFGHN